MSLSCSASLSDLLGDGDGCTSCFLLLSGEGEALGALAAATFFSSSSLRFFFSCFARSSAFVALVKAIVLPSGDHFGPPAPFGNSVKENESPPASASMVSCGGSGLPSFSIARRKTRNLPSGDQLGALSCLPLVSWCG